MKFRLLQSSLIFITCLAPTYATDYTTAASGNWDGAGVWSPAGTPKTGSTDNVTITAGFDILWNSIATGLSGSSELGTSGGHSITLDGGTLAQVPVANSVRIGQTNTGFLNINDGGFFFTSSTATSTSLPSLHVGLAGGTGTVNVGDSIGAPGSAILDLRHLPDGVTDNSISVFLNLGSTIATGGGVGNLTVYGDGLFISDKKALATDVSTATDPRVRIGQSTVLGRSTLLVQDGGKFQANGTVEIAYSVSGTARSNGLLHLTGSASLMEQTAGGVLIGRSADGEMVVENDASYTKLNSVGDKQDSYIGNLAGSVGTLTLASGGSFHLSPGTEVGDMRIGYQGTGTVDIKSGGTYFRESDNSDLIGQESTGVGTVNVFTGGLFRTTGNGSVVLGNAAGSNGLMTVQGGSISLEHSTAAIVRVGQAGTGTYRQTSGSSSIGAFTVGGTVGNGLVEIMDGTVDVRRTIYLGGNSTTATGTGSGTLKQSGGTLSVGGALSIGTAAGHNGIVELTGGTITHTASDFSIGENGNGLLTISAGGILIDSSPTGVFLVGRNAGSSGTAYIDGTLTRTSTTRFLRVGNGNSSGVENTTATGILGGTGTINITSPSAVVIGSKGTLTGGTIDTVGTLTINGNLNFVAGGTLRANFGSTGNVDRLNVNGTVNLTGALLTGTWAGGSSPAGPSSRYWLIVNDGTDAITGTFANTVATSDNASQAPGAAGFITLGSQEFAVYYGADQATGELTGGNDLLLVALAATNDQILKAVLGTSPTSGGPNLPTIVRQGGNLVLTYNRVEASTSSYTATVEYSPTLTEGSWTTATSEMTAVTGSGTSRTVTVAIPLGALRYFARVRITSNP